MNETHDSTNTTTITFVTDHFYSGLIGLLGSLAILLNGPLLIVLVKSKTLVFRSRMNYLVGSLALADFLTGTFSAHPYISRAYEVKGPEGDSRMPKKQHIKSLKFRIQI